MKPQASLAPNDLRSRVTIKDVALAAGVSPMTVSNVINGKVQYVSETTRETVRREIERLGYRVQKAGRNLKRSSPHQIGMVIVDDSPSFLVDHFTAHIVAGLSNTLSLRGYSLAIQGVRIGAFREASFLRNFEVDAICALLSGPQSIRDAMIDALRHQHEPVILFQEAEPHHRPNICVVRQDDFGGARLIAQHVLERGAKHIVFMRTEQEWPAMIAREAGVRAELDASGAGHRLDRVLCATEEFDDAQGALAAYLADHEMPDTIIGGNDRIGLAAMALLRSRGVDIPNQVRVTGFNAFEPRKYATPLLTTAASPAYRLGQAGGELLLDRMAGVPFPTPELVLPVSLEIGQTT